MPEMIERKMMDTRARTTQRVTHDLNTYLISCKGNFIELSLSTNIYSWSHAKIYFKISRFNERNKKLISNSF